MQLMGQETWTLEEFMKNIVYLELRRRGYEVYVGKTTKGEIDFVAVKDGKSITRSHIC